MPVRKRTPAQTNLCTMLNTSSYRCSRLHLSGLGVESGAGIGECSRGMEQLSTPKYAAISRSTRYIPGATQHSCCLFSCSILAPLCYETIPVSQK